MLCLTWRQRLWIWIFIDIIDFLLSLLFKRKMFPKGDRKPEETTLCPRILFSVHVIIVALLCSYSQKGFLRWHLCFLSLLSHCVVNLIFSNVLVCPYLTCMFFKRFSPWMWFSSLVKLFKLLVKIGEFWKKLKKKKVTMMMIKKQTTTTV